MKTDKVRPTPAAEALIRELYDEGCLYDFDQLVIDVVSRHFGELETELSAATEKTRVWVQRCKAIVEAVGRAKAEVQAMVDSTDEP